MPLLRRALAAALTLALVPLTLALTAPTAQAKPHHPAVRTATFQVRLALNGNYHQEVHYTDTNTDQFCPGTGEVLDANFGVAGVATLKVKLAATGSSHKTLSLDDLTNDDWNMDVVAIAVGDPCDRLQNATCSGATALDDRGGADNFAYAQSIGKKIVFGTETTGVPRTVDKPGDCFDNDADYYPGGEFSGLSAALAPYVSASMAVSLEKLMKMKKGETVDKVFKPLKENIPAGYDVASCDHYAGGACTGALNGFTHKLTIKRVS